jgi:hypothetical protein
MHIHVPCDGADALASVHVKGGPGDVDVLDNIDVEQMVANRGFCTMVRLPSFISVLLRF